MHEGLKVMSALDAPVVASVQGVAAGAGMSLVVACDFAFVASDTRLDLAFARIGAGGDTGCSWNLPRLVGLRKALEIAILNETLTADDALRLGLVTRVVSPQELSSATYAFARRIASGPTLAFGSLKRLMRMSFETSFPAQLDEERRVFCDLSATADFNEGVTAFLSKRPPRFQGK